MGEMRLYSSPSVDKGDSRDGGLCLFRSLL